MTFVFSYVCMTVYELAEVTCVHFHSYVILVGYTFSALV